jgi:hypothetical protein
MKYNPKIIRGVGIDKEKELGLPDMGTAPAYEEQSAKGTIPGKEGGDHTGIRPGNFDPNTTGR